MSYLRHLLFSSAPQRLFSPPVSLLLSLPPVLFHPRRLASSRATALISSALSGASSSVLLRRILARRRSSGLLSFSGFSLISHQRLFSSARRRSSLQRGGALWGRTIVRPHRHARDGAHLRATALILARRRSSVSLFLLSGFSLVSPQRLFSSARRRSSLQRGGALWGRSIVRPHAHARDGAHLRATALICLFLSSQRLLSRLSSAALLLRATALISSARRRFVGSYDRTTPHSRARRRSSSRDGAHLRATALILARRRSSHQRTALQRDDAHLRSSSRHLSFLPPPPSLLLLSSVL